MSPEGYVMLAYGAGLGLLVSYGAWLLIGLARLGAFRRASEDKS